MNKILSIRWITFVLIAFSVCGNLDMYAQNSDKGVISGRVVYANGTPVVMATILLKGTSLFAYSDENGDFTIGNLTLGKEYLLEVHGFDSQVLQRKIHLTKTQYHILLQFKKSEDISLEEVTVSSSSKGKQIKEQGYAMNVISTKEAVVQNIQTTELLGRSAGIKIRQSAGLGSDVTFNLNGLSGNSIRIFIDGIPIRNYGRSFSLSQIPPAMIERIEVYKGILPAHLSEDALGGGINVVLKKDMSRNLSASYSYGSFHTHQSDINASYRDKQTGFLATLSSFYNVTDNNYKVWGENVYVVNNRTGEKTPVIAERFHDKYYSSGIKINTGFTTRKWADELLLGLMFSETKKDIQTGATMEVVYGNRKTQYQSAMANLQYKKNDLITKGLDVSTFTAYSRTFRQIIDTIPYIYNWNGKIATDYDGNPLKWVSGAEGNLPTLANNKEQIISNRSNIHYHINKEHSVGVSFLLNTFTRNLDDPMLHKEAREALDTRQYHKQVLSFNYDFNFFSGKLKSSLLYKLYQQQVRLTEVNRLMLPDKSFINKIEKHDRTIKQPGYGLTLSYQLTPKLMISLSGERTTRLPGSTELLGNLSEGIFASPLLKPEYSYNGNFGVVISSLQYKKHQFSADINLFIRHIHDLIIRTLPSLGADYVGFENLGKIISRGTDLEFRYVWDNTFFITSAISYFNARFDLQYDEYGVKYVHYGDRLRNSPYFTSNINVEYMLGNHLLKKAKLSVGYNFGYTHQFFKEWESYGTTNKIIIPSQPLHDVSLTYRFPNRKFTLSFNAKNIFDTQVFDNYALQKPGRAFYGKLTYSLF
ncbi:MAG: TonB-dependent receptor plug domain-containing protein [Bacteroidota bacterium]|nr:TonB-dependent receptor plug domain-containing protein [Bacteroidota bacterium]